jgi:hypothetical protein
MYRVVACYALARKFLVEVEVEVEVDAFCQIFEPILATVSRRDPFLTSKSGQPMKNFTNTCGAVANLAQWQILHSGKCGTVANVAQWQMWHSGKCGTVCQQNAEIIIAVNCNNAVSS